MSFADYQTWLAATNVSRRVLALADPEEELLGLTAVGTTSTIPPTWIAGVQQAGSTNLTDTLTPFLSGTYPLLNTARNQILVVRAVCYSSTVTSVTWGGVALTKLDSFLSNLQDVEIWYLLNPGVPNGSRSLVFTMPGTSFEHAFSMDFYHGVDQTTPFSARVKTGGSGTTPSSNIASASNRLVIDVLGSSRAFSAVGAGQTIRLQTNTVDTYLGSDEVGAATTTMSWTTGTSGGYPDFWAQMVVSLMPATSPAFRVSFDQLVETTVVPGGMFTELMGVNFDGVALTARASVALVEANPSSYYYDNAGKFIYVNLPGYVAPTVASEITAIRRVRLSTDAVNFSDQPMFYPLISGGLPELRDDAEKVVSAVTQLTSGTLSVINSDKVWDRIGIKWLWRNRPVQFLYGGGSLAYSDYKQIGKLLFIDVAPGDRYCIFRLRVAEPLDKAFPQHTFGDFYAPPDFSTGLILPELEPLLMPMVWGTVKNAPAIYTGLYTGFGTLRRWTIVDPLQTSAGMAVTAVRARRKDNQVYTELDPAVDYTNLGYMLLISDAAWPHDDYDIFYDGYRNEPGVHTFGSIAKDMLTWAGVPASQIDTASFAQADIDAPAKLGLYIGGGSYPGMMLSEALKLLCSSVDGRISYTRDGKWRAQVWNPSFDHTTASVMFGPDITLWNPYVKIESIVYSVYAQYNHNYGNDTYQRVRAFDAKVGYRNNTKDSMTFQTLLVNQSDAAIFATRMLTKLKQGTTTIQLNERGSVTMEMSAWDKFLISRDRAPSPTGNFIKEAFEIIKISKRFSPNLSIELTIGNMSGLADTVRQWAPTGLPAFALATDEQKKTYGVWQDTDGTPNPGSPSIWY